MDDPGRIIVDISSDEDVGWGERGITSDGGGGGGGRDDSHWISDLLDGVEKETDDSDGVFMVGEVISNPKPMVVKSFAKRVDDEEDDDDDCVVLDGDPDKPLAIENDGGEDSDDLCVVGEKGQVACRDFPHPRHLCVKFPFNSTPHEKHCNQCHCYVCDSVAPCVHWGNGVSSVDHCHATEKDEFWKAQRRDSKKGCKAPQFVSGVGLPPVHQVPSLPSSHLMHNQLPPASQPCSITSTGAPNSLMPVRTHECGYNQVPPLPSNPLLHNPDLPASQPCSINSTGRPNRPVRTQGSGYNQVPSLFSTPLMHNLDLPSSQPSSLASTGSPNSLMPIRTQVSEYGLRNRFRPHLVSHHLRRHNVGYAGTQFISQRVPFKRPGMVGGVSTTNRHGDNSSRYNYGYQFSRNQIPGSRWQDPRFRGNAMSNTYQGANQANFGEGADHSVPNSSTWSPINNGHGNYAPLQPQISSQIHSSSVNANSVASYQLLSSQTCVSGNFGNSTSMVPGVATQQRWGNPFENLMPLQPQTASQPIAGRTYQNVVPAQPLVSFHGDINYPSESPVNFYQDSSMSQNSESLPVGCTQLESTSSQRPAIAINSPLSPSSNPHQMDSQFNTWSSEDMSALEALDIPLLPGLDLFSIESTLMDAGLLHDT